MINEVKWHTNKIEHWKNNIKYNTNNNDNKNSDTNRIIIIIIIIIILITTTIIIIIMIIYLISTSGLWASETNMVIACLTPAIPINTPTVILFAILLNTQPCIFFPIALLPSIWCSFILEKFLFSVSLLNENNQHLKNDSKDGEGPL